MRTGSISRWTADSHVVEHRVMTVVLGVLVGLVVFADVGADFLIRLMLWAFL